MKRLLVGNWKMNPQTLEEARFIAHRIEHGLLGLDRNRIEIAICPPFVFLPGLKHALHFAKLGGQNVSASSSGPYTGEISIHQLKEFGITYVIVGHSERRALGETDEYINKKLKILVENQTQPILCVGFGTKRNTPDSLKKAVVKKQLQVNLKGVKLAKSKLTICYEPTWVISQGRVGTGNPATPRHAAAMCQFINSVIPKTRVIYGGSLDSKNVGEFAEAKAIEGGLIGGASLHPDEFLAIVKVFAKS